MRRIDRPPMCRRSLVCAAILIVILLSVGKFYLKIDPAELSDDETNLSLARSSSLPTLARVLYLFICENQAEIDLYAQIFPSVSADAIFYCWRENCNSSRFSPSLEFYVHPWFTGIRKTQKLISLHPQVSFYPVRSRVYIINEKQLGLKTKLTWTTARNKMYEFALEEERKQGWRWAYFIFGDGDVHMACPLADQLSSNRSLVDYGNNEERIFAPQFLSFVSSTQIQNPEQKCFFLFDAFLLSLAPAVATVSGAAGPMAYPGLLAQVVYHIDGMFNAIHHDALRFLLPYCPRYDIRTWWTSQAIFVYRTLCVYGHLLQFDGLHIVRQNHRPYPRVGDPWAMDDDMNLVPNYLLRLKAYMKQNRFVSPIVLHHYSGWNLALTSETCRKNHTAMKIESCLVYGTERE